MYSSLQSYKFAGNVNFSVGGGRRPVERIDERIIVTPGREIIEETITRGPYRERIEETIITGPRREVFEERVIVGPRREIIEERVIVDRPGDSCTVPFYINISFFF